MFQFQNLLEDWEKDDLEELKEANPNYIIENIEELKNIL